MVRDCVRNCERVLSADECADVDGLCIFWPEGLCRSAPGQTA
jgi:hypothetical protein